MDCFTTCPPSSGAVRVGRTRRVEEEEEEEEEEEPPMYFSKFASVISWRSRVVMTKTVGRWWVGGWVVWVVWVRVGGLVVWVWVDGWVGA